MASLSSKPIFELSYELWNNLISIALTLFTMSPTSTGGTVYGVAHACFNAIKSISLPIATVFFIIAIIKDVMGTPPEQQARRFVQSALKFTVMVGILANLWEFMGYVIQIADGITDAVAGSGTYRIDMPAEMASMISEIENPTYTVSFTLGTIGEWFNERATGMVQGFILFMLSLGSVFFTVSAGLGVINCAFQRILKPLVILPFSTITIAMAAGSSEAERVSVSYLKAFFALCVSGALMVISVRLGNAMVTSGVFTLTTTSTDKWGKLIVVCVQNVVTPLVTVGLVRSADSMLSRFF